MEVDVSHENRMENHYTTECEVSIHRTSEETPPTEDVSEGVVRGTVAVAQWEYENVDLENSVTGSHTYTTPGLSSHRTESAPYWPPATMEDELKTQLRQLNVPEIGPTSLIICEELGCGQFGVVNRGLWSVGDEEREVAVKVLTDDSTEEKRVVFLREAAVMGQFDHPAILTLYGVNTTVKPLQLIVEMLHKGDLRKYLKSLIHKENKPLPSESCGLLLSFCRQIAAGMAYLSSKGFVHRDLAARNILVSQDDTCKICDFGMSRDLVDSDYYKMKSTARVPVKWTAPEALMYRKHSSASDVWSFGIVMYEIWSLGCKPYSSYTNSEALQMISTNQRLPPPPGCPRPIYHLMISCWNPEPSERPKFVSILQSLQHPDYKLLMWIPEDVAAYSEQARTLGAPLEAGEEMYKELQNMYSV